MNNFWSCVCFENCLYYNSSNCSFLRSCCCESGGGSPYTCTCCVHSKTQASLHADNWNSFLCLALSSANSSFLDHPKIQSVSSTQGDRWALFGFLLSVPKSRNYHLAWGRAHLFFSQELPSHTPVFQCLTIVVSYG